METASEAREILDTLLGKLGFAVNVEIAGGGAAPALQVLTEEAAALTGEDGERLDELQYLLNRLLQARHPGAARVRVDVEHFRAMQEDVLLEEARALAGQVRETGCPAKMRPLNSYFRRLVHAAFVNDPEIATWSPPDSARFKRVTLMPRQSPAGGKG